jgi:hypothetical protein
MGPLDDFGRCLVAIVLSLERLSLRPDHARVPSTTVKVYLSLSSKTPQPSPDTSPPGIGRCTTPCSMSALTAALGRAVASGPVPKPRSSRRGRSGTGQDDH